MEKLKRSHFDAFNISVSPQTARTAEEIERAYKEAVKKHPFHDNADHIIDFHSASVFRDANGAVCGVLLPGALPSFATAMAANVLRPAATRTSLRSNMFGGESPLSGIAGYYDYRGSPVELKCRKTSFTHEHIHSWPNVFPMIDYVSAIYKAVFPTNWAAQDSAIPDIVRIHGSPFSTLTINQRFRTASHTDSGDFDGGYGILAVLEGNFRGLHLSLDDFGVCFCMQPGDILIFNTHFFHSNTEPEVHHPNDDWDRLTCVFYYRAALGEPSCMKEYMRRLMHAKEIGASPPPVVDLILSKDNGENFNKPAPTFPPLLTPFIGAAGLASLEGCAAKLLRLHTLLLEDMSLAEVLFGEPLRVDDGLPAREASQLRSTHLPVILSAPPAGGFKENMGALKEAEERQYFFEERNLATVLGADLMEMWRQSRALWMKTVQEDWDRMQRKNPSRTNFTWNNKSAMNTAFFDLCEVAKQVMLALLCKETATPMEEQSFWLLFAAHFHFACVKELNMPREAVSMRKLNVKLKDFHFGGTRYLKDMSSEEQKRRLERRKRMEEARHRSGGPRESHSSSWLRNDAFDYQHEDAPVHFTAHHWPTPEENVRRLRLEPCGEAPIAAKVEEPITILVVLPSPAMKEEGKRRQKKKETPDAFETTRLLDNAASRRILSKKVPRNAQPSRPTLILGGVTIEFVFDDDHHHHHHHQYNNNNKNNSNDDAVGSVKQADFVILQHTLAAVTEEEKASLRLRAWTAVARHCVFVVETDLLDRRHFVLKEHVREAYESIAEECLSTLHLAAYKTSSVSLRSTESLIALTPQKCILARYKFIGSPLNTVALIVLGKPDM